MMLKVYVENIYLLEKDSLDDALEVLNVLFMQMIEKHASITKPTDRNLRSPWVDEELSNKVVQ